MIKKQVTIIGNSVASLVAGIDLAEKGYEINIINPLPNWGGHFGGIIVQNAHFDCGMTFFEFDSFQSTQSYDVLTYDSNLRNDSGRFTSLIKDYVDCLVKTRPVPKPKMLFNGAIVSDLMISNDLTSLIALSDEVKQDIKKELLTIVERSEKPLHAANKLKSNLFLTNNFDSVSIANHGKTFHNLFIESFSKKVLFKSSSEFLGLYHRILWLPLYYPETLLSQFDTVPQTLKSTQFHYPCWGFMGTLVNALLMKAQNNSRITIHKKSIASLSLKNSYKVQCDDGSVFETNQLVWNLNLSTILNLMEQNQKPVNYEKASITLCFIGVISEMVKVEFSTLFVLDEEYIPYRITNQNVCAGSDETVTKLVIEINTDFALSMQTVDEENLKLKIEDELIKLKIIEGKDAIQYFYCKHLKHTLIIPNKHNYECFIFERITVLDQCPNIKFTGGAASFMSTSLNDQMIQGLQIAKQVEE